MQGNGPNDTKNTRLSLITPINLFRVLVFVGIIPNVLLGAVAVMCPATLDTLAPPALGEETFWPRTAGVLLLIVTAIYVPVIQRPRRHLPIAWLLVCGRGAAGTSFLIGLRIGGYPSGATILAAHDLALALLQAAALGWATYGSQVQHRG